MVSWWAADSSWLAAGSNPTPLVNRYEPWITTTSMVNQPFELVNHHYNRHLWTTIKPVYKSLSLLTTRLITINRWLYRWMTAINNYNHHDQPSINHHQPSINRQFNQHWQPLVVLNHPLINAGHSPVIHQMDGWWWFMDGHSPVIHYGLNHHWSFTRHSPVVHSHHPSRFRASPANRSRWKPPSTKPCGARSWSKPWGKQQAERCDSMLCPGVLGADLSVKLWVITCGW